MRMCMEYMGFYAFVRKITHWFGKVFNQNNCLEKSIVALFTGCIHQVDQNRLTADAVLPVKMADGAGTGW